MKEKLKEVLSRHGENQTNLASEAAQNLIVDEIHEAILDHIAQLTDENESLWGMLDEIKAADIKNYSEEFRKMMDLKLVEIKMLASLKPGRA